MSDQVRFSAAPKTSLPGAGFLHNFGIGFPLMLQFLTHHFGNEGSQQVADAVAKAMAANVSWMSILNVIGPMIFGLFTGGTINLQGIIDAILALINPATA
jgi:hypothetical protein